MLRGCVHGFAGQGNADSTRKTTSELSPVVALAGQDLRDVEPRVRGRRLLLEHARVNASQRDYRPVITKVLLLGLSV